MRTWLREERSLQGRLLQTKKFRIYDKEPWHGRGLRVMPVDNYEVFYIPDDKTRIVTVIRVMYEGRDADAQLNRHTKM